MQLHAIDICIRWNRTIHDDSLIIYAAVAVIKYWGKHDVKLNTPMNSSASLTLDQVAHVLPVAWICIAMLCILIFFIIVNIVNTHASTRLKHLMQCHSIEGDDYITESHINC